MSMMYRIFFAILGAGALGGALFVLWARLFTAPTSSLGLFLGLSVAVGLLYGFLNYIFVKSVLRIFVNKFSTLERVLVGTEPKPLPNVFVSNEIDEMEAAMVRITHEFNKLRTGGARRTTRAGASRASGTSGTSTAGGDHES